MPKLRKLDASLAGRLEELFPPQAQHADLVVAFQKWEREDIK